MAQEPFCVIYELIRNGMDFFKIVSSVFFCFFVLNTVAAPGAPTHFDPKSVHFSQTNK